MSLATSPTSGPDAPVLRLRPLAQPHPPSWTAPEARPAPGSISRATTGRAYGGRYASDRQASGAQHSFVLHGLPTAAAEPAFEDPVPTPTSDLPCPEQLARRLVQAAVDVVRGHRPASQVLRWTTPEVYSQLRQRARLEQMAGRSGGRRPVVRSLRTHPCGERGVEVSAVVLDGPRARAVAARLDGEDSRWRLTALVIG